MTVTLNIKNQIYARQQMSSSDKDIIEKSQKAAIEAIILYLKNMDNTVCLKRTYSIREAFENLDLIIECEDYQSSMQVPNKKMKKSLEKSTLCANNSSTLQGLKVNKGVQRDFYTVLEAVKRDGLELQYASRRLQNNHLIAFHAVCQNGLALQYTSKKQMRLNRLALQAVRQNGLALQYLPHSLRDRFDIVAAAVRQNSSAFPFASKRLQNDDEIIEFARGTKKNNCSYAQHWFPKTFLQHHSSITSR